MPRPMTAGRCGVRAVEKRLLFAPMTALADEKYLLLTTFRKDGRAVPTPVWIVDLGDGTMGFWTSSGSGKAKRIINSGRVTVQPCDARGRITACSGPVDATAALVTGGQLDLISSKIKKKYGFMTKVTKLLAKANGLIKRKPIPYGDRGVVITLGSPDP